ncbi:MAG TPA: glycosyltransferase family 4 protein [Gemmatimonadaceae bacterium]|nr:glycosyltransferase family 4 protein [Gemmatimonadaceae bacterium]
MALRVLHVDSGRDWRGGQRQVFLLARGLREAGDEPLVAAYPDAPLIQRLRNAGVAASSLRMRADWDIVAARRLRALIRTWKPDVVHAHDARGHALALAALIGERGIPLVVTRRVTFVPRGRLKYGKRVSRFIAISQAVCAALQAGGVDPGRIDVVYSGVPAPKIERPRDWRAERGWSGQHVVLGVVGAMTSEKGVHLLADIANKLRPEIAERVRLVLLGGKAAGTEKIGQVEAYRAGFVYEPQAAMAGLDILLHPSSAEGLGTALIDAMALGVPPVTFAVGGIPELIVGGEVGVLIPAGDTTAFSAAVERLVTDPSERESLGSRGPSRAALFSVERMIEGTKQVYAQVLEATASRTAR